MQRDGEAVEYNSFIVQQRYSIHYRATQTEAVDNRVTVEERTEALWYYTERDREVK